MNQTKRNPKKYPGGYVPGHSLHLAPPPRLTLGVKVTGEAETTWLAFQLAT